MVYRIAIGRGHDPDVEFKLMSTTQAPYSAVGKHAKQLRLEQQRHLGNLVEKERSAVRLFETTLTHTDGAGEGTTFVAKEFAFDERFGNRRGIQRDEGLPFAPAQAMDTSRATSSLPVPLTGDHHADVSVPRRFDQFEDPRIGLPADEVAESAFGFGPRGQPLALRRSSTLFCVIQQRLSSTRQIGDRFGQEVARTLLHGFDGHIDTALSCKQQDRPMRIPGLQHAQKFEAGDLRHDNITNNDVRIVLFDKFGSLHGIRCLKNLEPPIVQQDLHGFTDTGIVVNNEDFFLTCGHDPQIIP
jgi:hypothetical protein